MAGYTFTPLTPTAFLNRARDVASACDAGLIVAGGPEDDYEDRLRRGAYLHLCAAPAVLTMLATGHPGDRRVNRRVRVATGGAPPPRPCWNVWTTSRWTSPICTASPRPSAPSRSTSGIPHGIAKGSGNALGYLGEEPAADEWLRTGDPAVMHDDGYVEIRDRLKDVIVSGGENIASVEVERVLESHPAVLECAMVGRPDGTWGEVPVACVTIRPGQEVTEEELVRYVRARTARFKAPKAVLFGPLPKTSTGKIRKGLLRENLRRSASADLAASDCRQVTRP